MGLKDFITDVRNMIDDVHTKGFTYNTSSKVPSLSDCDLTYESGDAKKGKCIETCVLFVDIRNSVELTREHDTETMGRIYTAFTKGVLNAKGKADTKELQSFLDYLEGKQDLQDPLVQSLQEEQKFASQNAEWRADYMKLVARDMDQRAIGREEGLREGIFRSIRRLLANHIPAEEVKRLLDVTDEDIRMAQKK